MANPSDKILTPVKFDPFPRDNLIDPLSRVLKEKNKGGLVPVPLADWQIESDTSIYTNFAGTTPVSDGSYVRNWTDLSGNDWDATLSDGIPDGNAALPIYRASIDSFPVVEFISPPIGPTIGSYLDISFNIGEVGSFYFLVYPHNRAVLASRQILFGNSQYQIISGGSDAKMFRNSNYSIMLPPRVNQWRLIHGSFDGSKLTLKENGVLVGEDNAGSVVATGALTVLAGDHLHQNNWFDGYIILGRVFNTPVSEAQDLAILTEISTKYAALPNFSVALDGIDPNVEAAPAADFKVGGQSQFYFTNTSGTTWAFTGDRVELANESSGTVGGRLIENDANDATHPFLRSKNGLKCLEFDGVDDRMQFNSWLEDDKSYSFLIMCKQERTAFEGINRFLLSHQDAVTTNHYRFLRANGAADQSSMFSSALANGQATTGVFINTWIAYGVTFDHLTNTTKLYVNGYEVDSIVEARDNSVNLAVEPLLGGRFNAGASANEFDGWISELRMYKDKVLTPAEMLTKALDVGQGQLVTPINLNGIFPDIYWTGKEAMYSDALATTIQSTGGQPIRAWMSQSKTPYIALRDSSSAPQLSNLDGLKSLYFPVGNTTRYTHHQYWGDYHTVVAVCHQTAVSKSFLTLLTYWQTSGQNFAFRVVRALSAGKLGVHGSGVSGVEADNVEDAWYLYAMRFDDANGTEVVIDGVSTTNATPNTRAAPSLTTAFFPMIGAKYDGSNKVDYCDTLRVPAIAICKTRLNDSDFADLQAGVHSEYSGILPALP